MKPFAPVRRLVAVLLIVAFSGAVLAAPEDAPAIPASKGSGVLTGVVRGTDGKPAAGVKLVLAPMQREGAPVVATTNAKGTYRFEKLSYGYYSLAAESQGAAFLGNAPVLVPPKRKVTANFLLGGFRAADASVGLTQGLDATGLGRPATGLARLEEKTGPSGLAWLRTGKGVALMIGAGVLIVGGIIASSAGTTTRTTNPTSYY